MKSYKHDALAHAIVSVVFLIGLVTFGMGAIAFKMNQFDVSAVTFGISAGSAMLNFCLLMFVNPVREAFGI